MGYELTPAELVKLGLLDFRFKIFDVNEQIDGFGQTGILRDAGDLSKVQ